MKPDRYSMEIISTLEQKYSEIMMCCEIVSEVNLGNNLVLLAYYPPNNTFANKLETDISNLKADFKSGVVDRISISTASAILSYARIYMQKVKLDILSKGGNIYYSDTDSITTLSLK